MSYKTNLQINNTTIRANNTDLQSLIEQANSLPDAGGSNGGVELPELTTPAIPDEVFLNQEYIDANGKKKTGTFTIDSELTQQDNLIAQIQNVIDELPNTGSGGGGNTKPSAQKKEVNFYDYDGTILYSYTVAEAQALTSLPELPLYEGLIYQGWNYDLATIKSYNRAVDVGAMYITDDGKTRIYIHLEEGRTSPMLGCCPKGTVAVDWGDGSTETLSGTSTSTVQWTSNHDYESAGDYVITLTVDGSMGFYGSNTSKEFSGLLRYSSSGDNRNQVYQNAIQKVEIGSGVTSISTQAFYNCHSLASITIPNGVTSIGSNTFQNCYSLASITIPNSVTSIGSNTFQNCYSLASITIPNSVRSMGVGAFDSCYSLTSITIPNGVTSIGSNTFLYCYSLASITIPDGVTSISGASFSYCNSLASITIPNSARIIGNSAFKDCRSLVSITIPNSVTSVDGSVFQNCYGMAVCDFTSHTFVPTLASTSAFQNISSDCKIKVPASLYDEWIAATNWSTYASYIVDENGNKGSGDSGIGGA